MSDSSCRQAPAYDWIGLSAGLLCAVHCALTPLLFAAVPLLREAGGWWAFLDVVFLVVSLLGVWGVVRSTGPKWVRWGAPLGWLALAIGLASERTGMPGSDYIMYLGAGVLLAVHSINLWRHHRHEACTTYSKAFGGDAGAGKSTYGNLPANRPT